MVKVKDKEGNEVEKEELEIDIKMMNNLINELRLKINIIMAGDYGIDEKDVEIANKLNELNLKMKNLDSLETMRINYDDREELIRVQKILLEDYSFIKDKYWRQSPFSSIGSD